MWLSQFGEDPSLAFLPQPVALATDGDGRREVQEPIQDRRCQYLVSEDVAPLAVGLARDQDDRSSTIGPADQLEQELRGHPIQEKVAHFVQSEQLRSTEGVEPVVQPILFGISVQLLQQVDDVVT